MKAQVKRTDLPRTAIIEAILRCQGGCNPAIIRRGSYAIHVRRLPVAEGEGWVVRIISGEGQAESSKRDD